MRFSTPGNVGRSLSWMLRKPQILRIMRPGHQGAVLAAGETVLNPRRVFVARSADAVVERAATTPTEMNVLVGEPLTVLALLFL